MINITAEYLLSDSIRHPGFVGCFLVILFLLLYIIYLIKLGRYI